jgi:heme exporter protein D
VSLYVAAGRATAAAPRPIFRPPRGHAGTKVNGFFAMGGYAAYVWPAYAAALIALGGLTLLSLLSRARVRRELRERGLDRRGARS